MSKLFGTDGVRGIVNEEITSHLAFDLGQAGAHVLSKSTKRPKILIGDDSRISSDMLESALVAGICAVGGDVYLAHTISTPAIAYLTKKYKFDAGIMISASHNPMEYNGIKFFDSNGFKLADAVQDEIEDLILHDKSIPNKTGAEIGRRYSMDNAYEEYIEFLSSTTSTSLSGIKVVVDCANGASSPCASRVLDALGADVIPIHDAPSGTNINHNCGSTHPEIMCEEVLRSGADLGLAFDGDADRLIACDGEGNVVDGDHIMAICAVNLKNQGKLQDDTLVTTIMSNMGLFKAMEQHGIRTVTTDVGDRYVLEEMQKNGYSLGGEQSGHIIFSEYSTTGDGLVSAVQLMSILKESGKTLAQLSAVMEDWPQILLNAKVTPGKQKTYLEHPEIVAKIQEYNDKYQGDGRLLVRPSGTEPLIRVMIEGKDKKLIREDARALVDFIEQTIG